MTSPPGMPLHATLARQLRRLRLDAQSLPDTRAQWTQLLASIDRAYREADELVYLVGHSERVVTGELARSQQALAQAQRLAGLGSWTLDLATRQFEISDELASLLGRLDGPRQMSIEALLGHVAPGDRVSASQLLACAVAEPLHRAGEIRFVSSEGRERWCLCRVASQTDDSGRVTRVDGTVFDITERRAAEERTRELARTDPLTGLANRAHFYHLLSGAIEAAHLAQSAVAVVFVDLDGFKSVNDTCGHHVGDSLLETISRRLRSGLRGSDVVGRFGGDEFVLLLQGLGSAEEVSLVATKVLRACSTQVAHDGAVVSVSASVGVAMYPGDGDDAEQLLKSADAATYAAKESGRNTVRFFGAEVRAQRLSERAMVAALRTAIARDEIRVAYQPVVDGRSGQVLGLEALARWPLGPNGAVEPTEFIALAESHHLIGALCQRVATVACAQLAALPEELQRERWVSINVSPVQLRSPEFIRFAEQLIEHTGVDPRRVCLEITENAVMHDPGLAVRMLSKLKSLGVSIWLDDFGTGHSSLAYLRQLPVDCIKIDRSFVAEIQGHTAGPLLQGIIAMARSVGCEVLAEGVETEAQRRALLQAGCRLMQGFLFGLPDSFERWNPPLPADQRARRQSSSNTPPSTTLTAAHSNVVTLSPATITPSSIAITGFTKV